MTDTPITSKSLENSPNTYTTNDLSSLNSPAQSGYTQNTDLPTWIERIGGETIISISDTLVMECDDISTLNKPLDEILHQSNSSSVVLGRLLLIKSKDIHGIGESYQILYNNKLSFTILPNMDIKFSSSDQKNTSNLTENSIILTMSTIKHHSYQNSIGSKSNISDITFGVSYAIIIKDRFNYFLFASKLQDILSELIFQDICYEIPSVQSASTPIKSSMTSSETSDSLPYYTQPMTQNTTQNIMNSALGLGTGWNEPASLMFVNKLQQAMKRLESFVSEGNVYYQRLKHILHSKMAVSDALAMISDDPKSLSREDIHSILESTQSDKLLANDLDVYALKRLESKAFTHEELTYLLAQKLGQTNNIPKSLPSSTPNMSDNILTTNVPMVLFTPQKNSSSMDDHRDHRENKVVAENGKLNRSSSLSSIASDLSITQSVNSEADDNDSSSVSSRLSSRVMSLDGDIVDGIASLQPIEGNEEFYSAYFQPMIPLPCPKPSPILSKVQHSFQNSPQSSPISIDSVSSINQFSPERLRNYRISSLPSTPKKLPQSIPKLSIPAYYSRDNDSNNNSSNSPFMSINPYASPYSKRVLDMMNLHDPFTPPHVSTPIASLANTFDTIYGSKEEEIVEQFENPMKVQSKERNSTRQFFDSSTEQSTLSSLLISSNPMPTPSAPIKSSPMMFSPKSSSYSSGSLLLSPTLESSPKSMQSPSMTTIPPITRGDRLISPYYRYQIRSSMLSPSDMYSTNDTSILSDDSNNNSNTSSDNNNCSNTTNENKDRDKNNLAYYSTSSNSIAVESMLTQIEAVLKSNQTTPTKINPNTVTDKDTSGSSQSNIAEVSPSSPTPSSTSVSIPTSESSLVQSKKSLSMSLPEYSMELSAEPNPEQLNRLSLELTSNNNNSKSNHPSIPKPMNSPTSKPKSPRELIKTLSPRNKSIPFPQPAPILSKRPVVTHYKPFFTPQRIKIIVMIAKTLASCLCIGIIWRTISIYPRNRRDDTKDHNSNGSGNSNHRSQTIETIERSTDDVSVFFSDSVVYKNKKISSDTIGIAEFDNMIEDQEDQQNNHDISNIDMDERHRNQRNLLTFLMEMIGIAYRELVSILAIHPDDMMYAAHGL